MIFLDTDILSYFLSGNKDIYAKIQEAINGGKRICITWINVYEIFKGLRFNNSYKKEEMFKNFLNVIDIYGLNDVSIIAAANIYAELRRTGQPIGDADILIAAIVIANNGMLITNNEKHYSRICDLKIENWLAG